jgi:DNA-binding transcriptional regulator PaaX
VQKKQFQKVIFSATDSIVGNITDLLLTQIFFALGTVGAKSSYDIHKACAEAQALVNEEINHKTIKRAFYNLTKKGFIKRSPKRTALEIKITKLGRQRINEIVPTYHNNRPWDGHVYLISYDIPTQANHQRNLLRNYLKRIGCGLLQESLWITPYNPTDIVKEFISDHKTPGTILISKLGHDGSIGDENLKDLIIKVYKLDNLAKQYQKFIKKCITYEKTAKMMLIIKYYSILKDDPQLPFQLMPPNFPDRKAYNAYVRLTNI